jgi:hypothetical protein
MKPNILNPHPWSKTKSAEENSDTIKITDTSISLKQIYLFITYTIENVDSIISVVRTAQLYAYMFSSEEGCV